MKTNNKGKQKVIGEQQSGEQKTNPNHDTSANALYSSMAAQDEQKKSSPLHPIFEQALKPFMP